MSCTTCGADLPAGAKFCAECGARVGIETDATTVLEAVTGRADAVPERVETVGSDPELETELVPEVPPAGAMPSQAPAPAPATAPRDRGAVGEFVDALAPILRSPRVTANLLAALIALAISIAVSIVLWAFAANAFEDHADLLLPPFVDPDMEPFGIVSLLTSVLHQVPLVNDDGMFANAPFLLATVPLLACAIGLRVARRAMPCSTRGGFVVRHTPFAIAYGVLVFVWSLFGSQDWHGAHVRSLLFGIAFALAGAVFHDRLLARSDVDGATAHAGPADGDHDDGAPTGERSRLAGAMRAAARVLALMLVVGALGLLVAKTIEAIDGDDAGPGVASAVLQIVEGGFEAIGFGVLAESYQGSGDDSDGVRVHETDDLLSTAAFVILLVTSLGIVLLGGLFSGFSIAREVRPRTRNDHVLYGALTGVAWAVAMLVAQLVVLTRAGDGDETYTLFDGVETFFLSLLIGAVLGSLGGLLAASSRRDEMRVAG